MSGKKQLTDDDDEQQPTIHERLSNGCQTVHEWLRNSYELFRSGYKLFRNCYERCRNDDNET